MFAGARIWLQRSHPYARQIFGVLYPNKKYCNFRCNIFGREGKTTLELTYSIILNLESYAKAVAGLQELVAWKPTVPAYAIAL